MGLQKSVRRKKAIKFTANERALGIHKKCSKHNKLETDISSSKKMCSNHTKQQKDAVYVDRETERKRGEK